MLGWVARSIRSEILLYSREGVPPPQRPPSPPYGCPRERARGEVRALVRACAAACAYVCAHVCTCTCARVALARSHATVRVCACASLPRVRAGVCVRFIRVLWRVCICARLPCLPSLPCVPCSVLPSPLSSVLTLCACAGRCCTALTVPRHYSLDVRTVHASLLAHRSFLT